MATISTSKLQAEQRFVLYGVSWATYERLLDDFSDNSCTRFAYDQGALEMMSPSGDHDWFGRMLGHVVSIVADELDIPMRVFGSTTWRREDVQRGFEADECFYIGHEAVQGLPRKVDLNTDPPPNLIIEVEISRSVINKLGIYSALGVRELWRYDGERLRVFELDANRQYVERERGVALPMLPLATIEQFLERRDHPNDVVWLREVRAWVRANLVNR